MAISQKDVGDYTYSLSLTADQLPDGNGNYSVSLYVRPGRLQILPKAVTITTGSATGAMAHMKLKMHDRLLDGVAAGDGPIDAAFLAIEHATGRHFELDNFTIQAITEGHESTGETIIRLRHQGKLYSGRGISTDIVGASIMAYINAVNKIFYEEEEA